jgi:hypothetical protein
MSERKGVKQRKYRKTDRATERERKGKQRKLSEEKWEAERIFCAGIFKPLLELGTE